MCRLLLTCTKARKAHSIKVCFTDILNLSVTSRCLSLKCGRNPMFREYQWSASLPTICSASGRNTKYFYKWEICIWTWLFCLKLNQNTTIKGQNDCHLKQLAIAYHSNTHTDELFIICPYKCILYKPTSTLGEIWIIKLTFIIIKIIAR